jgi:hypothetical protein
LYVRKQEKKERKAALRGREPTEREQIKRRKDLPLEIVCNLKIELDEKVSSLKRLTLSDSNNDFITVI